LKHLIVIEKYFKDGLNKKELKDFLNELKTNSELRNEFNKIEQIGKFVDLKDGTFFDDIRKMVDFNFDPDIYLDILKLNYPLQPGEEDINIPPQKE
jgi:hypothetical protein